MIHYLTRGVQGIRVLARRHREPIVPGMATALCARQSESTGVYNRCSIQSVGNSVMHMSTSSVPDHPQLLAKRARGRPVLALGCDRLACRGRARVSRMLDGTHFRPVDRRWVKIVGA